MHYTDDTTLIHFTGSRQSFFIIIIISCNIKSRKQLTFKAHSLSLSLKSHAWIFARSPLTLQIQLHAELLLLFAVISTCWRDCKENHNQPNYQLPVDWCTIAIDKNPYGRMQPRKPSQRHPQTVCVLIWPLLNSPAVPDETSKRIWL